MKLTQLIAIFTAGVLFISCNEGGKAGDVFKTKNDSISYALGSVQAQGMFAQLEQLKVKRSINHKWFLKGAKDNLGETSLFTERVGNQFLNQLMQRVQMDSAFVLPEAGTGDSLMNSTDSMSYAFGLNLMTGVDRAITQLNLEGINKELAYQGIEDVLTDTALIPHQVGITMLNKIVSDFRQAQQAKQAEENEVKFGDNKKAGEEFLAENAKREEVKVTGSGLQYEVLKEGNGPKPGPQDKVKVHYHGTLVDGSVFDSSVERGEPAEFGVTQVISGWTEALQMMKVGSKWKVYIPYDLAYGAQQRGPKIKPYSALVFEVELLEIVK